MGKKILINLLVVAVAVGAGLTASRKPWEVWLEQRQRTADQVAQTRRSESRREELLREEARAKSSIGREELARGQGYLKAGEKPVNQ